MTRWGIRAALVALSAAGSSFVHAPVAAQRGDPYPVGVWNIRSEEMTDRATGGVRVVLLRVEEQGGDLHGEITSIRNTFMPVEALDWSEGELRVVFGSYEYRLSMDGDELTGTVTSPLGTLPVSGFRQHETLLYVGDEPRPFRTTRPGVLGHRELLEPPEAASDTAAWVLSRIDSVGDLALVVGRRAKVAVPFTNAAEFEDELRELAGQQVTVVGTWVGERLRIEEIEPGTP